nr:MAG TPA: hypothetical protein [Caudoviricetes sp.]
MAINNGASTLASGTTYQITMRLGIYADFDPDKMVPGELAVVTSGDPSTEDGKCMYVCFQAGNVKRLATYEDMLEYIQNATEDIQNAFTDDLQQAIKNAQSATSAANTATNKANTATNNANNAATAANNALESIKEAVQGTIINDTTPSSNTTYSGDKIDDMAKVNLFNIGEAVNFHGATHTVNGNKITVKYSSQGTASPHLQLRFRNLKANTYYYISYISTRTGENGGGIAVGYYSNSSYNALQNYASVLNGNFSFKTPDSCDYIYVNLYAGIYPNVSINDSATFEVMLIEGTEYAPIMYNSRDIAKLSTTVSNRTVINLFDASSFTADINAKHEAYGNGIKVTTTKSDTSYESTRKNLKSVLKNNTNYTICAKSTRTGEDGGGIVVYNIAQSDGKLTYLSDHGNDLNPIANFNSGNIDDFREITVLFYSGNEVGDSATFTDIMLVEGEFPPGEYVPYIGADTFSDAIAGIKTTNTEMATNILQNASDISELQMNLTDTKKEIETVDEKISDYKLLWSGNYYPTDEQRCNLSEKVSAQKNGIVLWFSFYTPGESSDQTGWWPYYVHKSLLDVKSDVGNPSSGCCVPLISNTTFTVIGTKYIYIFDTYVTGHATNNQSGTKNGITYDNGKFSLRYIYGW